MYKKTFFFITVFFLSTLITNAQSFWGMTNQGGDNNDGVIFKTDSNGDNYTVIRSMDDGQRTRSSFMQASNGKLYGMSNGGGNPDIEKGTIFEIDLSTETYTELAYFNCLFGCEPQGALIEATNGLFYGITSNGATPSEGALFSFNTTNNLITRLINFTGDNGSLSDRNSSVLEVNGNIYGVTSGGGINDDGVLFKYNIANSTYEVKYDFNPTTPGANLVTGSVPYGGLVKASDGLLYGTTILGGTDDSGVLFRYNPTTEIYTKIYDFIDTPLSSDDQGIRPEGELIEVSPGILYGTTSLGGINSTGVIFEYNINTDTYTKKADFDRSNNNVTGKTPVCKLMLAINGNLYGMAARGGGDNLGTIYEYNIATQTIVKKHDFDESSGKFPNRINLIQTTSNLGVSEHARNPLNINVSPNPTKSNIHINFKSNEAYTLFVYDVFGKKMFHEEKLQQINTFDFSKYATGTYILKIKELRTNRVKYFRIVKG